MKSRSAITLGIVCSVLFVVISLFIGISLVTYNVIGINQSLVITKVFVWNTEPTLYDMEVTPSSIDLNPGNTTLINCTGYVWDYNGWQDIKNVSAHFYDLTYGYGADVDNNYRYINYTCGNATTTCREITETNASCTCLFNVHYYANNGTWVCNMTITDDGGNATERIYNFNSSNNLSVTINPVLALNTPEEIDYGNLSVTETSIEKILNISNFGNIPINISVTMIITKDSDNAILMPVKMLGRASGKITFRNKLKGLSFIIIAAFLLISLLK